MQFKSIFMAIAFFGFMSTSPAGAVDTDGDGLLDLIDVPGFNPTGKWSRADFGERRVQDLDGASQLTNLQWLRLGDNQITSIERGDFAGLNNLWWLHLHDNQITSFESGDFGGLNNLRELNVADNQITSIESGDFDGLNNLRELNVADNQITSIESGDFAGLNNLQRLILSGNQITSLENGAFDGLNNLQSLELWGNPITSLESGAFQGLTNLQYLGLDGNQISHLESGAFQGLVNVNWLDLRGAQLTSLENGTFKGLNNLPFLSLSGNQITSIESGAFDGLTNLQSLGLSANQITSIESGAFDGMANLSTLDLTGNQMTELNFTEAELPELFGCEPFDPFEEGRSGFCADAASLTSLSLDDATLSILSFDAITSQTPVITDASLIGLRFSDEKPSDLTKLLGIETLNNVTIDQSLFDTYADELSAFATQVGNTLTVIGYGDANTDGEFNSSDLVKVFAAGEYEDDVVDNSYWTTGDWNGDGDFTSADLVVAFEAGRYEQGPIEAMSAVPEPRSVVPLVVALGWILQFVIRKKRPDYGHESQGTCLTDGSGD